MVLLVRLKVYVCCIEAIPSAIIGLNRSSVTWKPTSYSMIITAKALNLKQDIEGTINVVSFVKILEQS